MRKCDRVQERIKCYAGCVCVCVCERERGLGIVWVFIVKVFNQELYWKPQNKLKRLTIISFFSLKGTTSSNQDHVVLNICTRVLTKKLFNVWARMTSSNSKGGYLRFKEDNFCK